MEVNIPDRKPGGFSQLMNMGTQGASMWGAGKGIAGLFGGGGGPDAAKELWPKELGYGGETATASETAGAGGAGSAGGLVPVAGYAAATVMADNQRNREDSAIARRNAAAHEQYKQTELGKNEGTMSEEQVMANTGRTTVGNGLSLTANPNEEKSAAIQRRMDSKSQGNAADILASAKSSLGSLKLDDPTKQLIGRKLDLGLSKLFKLKA
jgi:hypothetical protein